MTFACIRRIFVIVQQEATQSSLFIIIQVHSKCFGCQPPIMSAQNCNYNLRYSVAACIQRGQPLPRWREAAAQKI